MSECEKVLIDGEYIRVQGALKPEDMEPFADVVRAAREFARSQAPKPCHSSRCDYDEPHKHGFACGPRCLCGEGMQAAVPLNSETGDKP